MNSLNIWHELDHPTHPLSADEKASVVGGAVIGSKVARTHEGEPWLDVMEEVYSRSDTPANTTEMFIGEAIGVYGGLMGFDISGEDSGAFRLTGEEISQIRIAKQRGAAMSHLYDPASAQTYSALTQRLRVGTLFPDEPTTLIGLGIGLRYANLSQPQREAA